MATTYSLSSLNKKYFFQSKRCGVKPAVGDTVTLVKTTAKDYTVRLNSGSNFYEATVTKSNYTSVMS